MFKPQNNRTDFSVERRSILFGIMLSSDLKYLKRSPRMPKSQDKTEEKIGIN